MSHRVNTCLKRVWRIIGAVSVRTKIMGIVLGLVALLGIAVTVQMRVMMANVLSREMEQRSISVTRDLAARSTDLVLTNDLYALHELLRDTAANNEDLRYAFVLDAQGQVLAHTFERGTPPGLLAVNRPRSDERYHLQVVDTEQGLIHDVAVPIFQGRAGTARAGFSEQRLQSLLAAVTRQLLLITFLASVVGILGGYLLAWILTRPVQVLVEVTRAVASGDLSRRAPCWANDEIGDLGAAFNAMVESLSRSQAENEAYNRQLLRRHRELAATVSIAQAMSGPLTLNQTIELALEQVLSVMDSEIGWICLVNESGACRVFAEVGGCCPPESHGRLGSCLSQCACRQSLASGEAVVVHPLRPECILAHTSKTPGRHVIGHIAIPLIVKGRIVGLLNVACHNVQCFNSDNLNLLHAMGQQLGVALENARLWDELKRRDAMRGHLLEQAMTAQEEERKRIARELHDQTGQLLTSLLVGLRTLENGCNPIHLQDLKAIVAEALQGVRNLALELRPSVLDDLGLAPALERYIQTFSRRYNLPVDFQTVGLNGEFRCPSAVETALYRIVQEALTNVARHAQARQASVLLEKRGASLVVIVEDDGVGFDTDQLMTGPVNEHWLGLHGMRERAELVGAALTIESTPGVGTTVLIEAPLAEWAITDDG